VWHADERGSRPAAARMRWRQAAVGSRAHVGAGESEAPTCGPAQRVGPSHKERSEGREGDRWAWFSNLNQIERFKPFELDSTQHWPSQTPKIQNKIWLESS
jgi:hypothetical protein